MSDTLVQSVPLASQDLTNVQERPVSLLGLTRQMLADWLVGQGEKPYRAQQLMQWVHQRGVLDYGQMTDLSKVLREKLAGLAPITLPQIKVDQQASDGTRKWLLEVDGHNSIEMVFIPDTGRGTLCISSQVGCALACTFCMTATQGFNRNLSSDEIIGQVWLAQHLLRQDGWGENPVTNVVFMGMGEPLLNVNQVFPAAEILMDDWAYGLSKRRVTISTSGVVPAMDMLTDRLDISLAVSLHAANDTLRNELVPINQKYPLAELMAACKRFLAKHPRRHIMFEYVMLEGINDTVKHAKEIITLLQGMSVKVNLIPFNPFPGSNYKTTEWDAAVEFQNRLIRSGVHTNIRRTRGEDIDAACGQLAGQVADRTKRQFRQHSVRFAPRAAGRAHAGKSHG